MGVELIIPQKDETAQKDEPELLKTQIKDVFIKNVLAAKPKRPIATAGAGVQGDEVLNSRKRMTSVIIHEKILEVVKQNGYTFSEWIEDRFFEWLNGNQNKHVEIR